MKTYTTFRLLIICVLLGTYLLVSCEKDNRKDNRLPSTPEEMATSTAMTKLIAEESHVIIENAINKALSQNSTIDLDEIVQEIKLIEGVVSAVPSSNNEFIYIEQKDGICINATIIDACDDRLFTITSTKSSVIDETVSDPISDLYFPTGGCKALILAPFQFEINSPIDLLYDRLSKAGYRVDTLSNKRATIEYFRGDTLKKYDIVLIFSHGGSNGHTIMKDEYGNYVYSNIVCTRTIQDLEQNYKILTPEEYGSASIQSLDGSAYLAMSVPWLYETCNKDFPNSWVYIGSCNSAADLTGPSSLAAAFLDLGAGGYNGFASLTINTIINNVAKKMSLKFLTGISFKDAADKVRNDVFLQSNFTTWAINHFFGTSYNLTSFIDIQRKTEDFYLFDPKSPHELKLWSAVVEDLTPNILNLGFNYQLAPVIPSFNAFSIAVNSTNVAVKSVTISDETILVALAVPVKKNDIVKVSYTKPAVNPLQTMSGLQVDSFTGQQVTNNVNVTNSGIIFNPNKLYGSVSDIDGNVYKTIQIGTQTWMAENLKTSKFNDNTTIPFVADPRTWRYLSSPALCWWELDEDTYKDIYGALYNWHAVNTGKLCPQGWHVPTEPEWSVLIDHLGGMSVAGGKLKEEGTLHWIEPNTGATNLSGFTALPGGMRTPSGYDGRFWDTWGGKSTKAYFWTSTSQPSQDEFAWGKGLSTYDDEVHWWSSFSTYDGYLGSAKYKGLSVRCIKD